MYTYTRARIWDTDTCTRTLPYNVIEGFTTTNFIIFTPIKMYIDCAQFDVQSLSSSLGTACLWGRRFLGCASRNQALLRKRPWLSFFKRAIGWSDWPAILYIDGDPYGGSHRNEYLIYNCTFSETLLLPTCSCNIRINYLSGATII